LLAYELNYLYQLLLSLYHAVIELSNILEQDGPVVGPWLTWPTCWCLWLLNTHWKVTCML